jgi:hypothetical protein
MIFFILFYAVRLGLMYIFHYILKCLLLIMKYHMLFFCFLLCCETGSDVYFVMNWYDVFHNEKPH